MDFCFENSDLQGRVRSCGIIIKDNKVLMVSNPESDYFYSLGGGVKVGETIEEACLREVYEETGVHFELDRLVFLHENFFYDPQQRLFHEIAFYFLMKPCTFDTLSSSTPLEELVWIPLDEFDQHITYPTFFAKYLKNIPDKLTHIVTYEDRKKITLEINSEI